jgi:hypothetical protein
LALKPTRIELRCVCGALIVTVAISGLVFHHDPETHTERPEQPIARGGAAVSTTTLTPGGPVFGDFFRSTST